MEDIKKIQEFFSKPLNENKVTKEDFNKVVKVLSASKYPFTIMLVPKWDEIDIITGQDSPDEIVDDIGQRLDSAGLNWGGNSGITISGDSSNYSRREYSDIFRVKGGHKDYFKESYASSFGGFRKELDGETIENELQAKGYETPRTGIWNKILVNKNGERVAMIDTDESSYTKDGKSYQWKGISNFINHVESVNEMDMNDPIMMKMRAAKDKLAKMRATNAGDDGNDKFFDNAKKIAFLKKERAQLMRDMEQEAEPEGGPIADEYGAKLNRIDKAIAKLSGRKEMDYDTAVGKVNEYDVYMPSQEEVDQFFSKTNLETHYLNSKPVMGQEGTFNLMPIEPWDEYDLSNWNSLVRKAKQQGKSIAETLAETIKLGEGVIEEELCPKGKAYIKRRKAAGEKSSAYLSGRAVKVCKGQMSGRKKKK